MATVVMSIGIPGSGKSTLMKRVADKGCCTLIGPDILRLEEHGDETHQHDDKAIWELLRSRVGELLQRGENVVVDSTFHTAKRRKHFVDFVKTHGATRIEALFFDIPLSVILERSHGRHIDGGKSVPSDYIEKAHAELQENIPSLEEGIDVLYRIDEHDDTEMIGGGPSGILSAYFQKP